MEPVELWDLPDQALLLIDSAPIIYHLEGHPEFGPRFRPVFDAHAEHRVRLAITTLAISEVLTGPLQAGNEVLARRYRSIFESWHTVGLDTDIAARAAQLRASFRLRLPDAVQAASALAINAAALVTNDRIFSRVDSLSIIT